MPFHFYLFSLVYIYIKVYIIDVSIFHMSIIWSLGFPSLLKTTVSQHSANVGKEQKSSHAKEIFLPCTLHFLFQHSCAQCCLLMFFHFFKLLILIIICSLHWQLQVVEVEYLESLIFSVYFFFLWSQSFCCDIQHSEMSICGFCFCSSSFSCVCSFYGFFCWVQMHLCNVL